MPDVPSNPHKGISRDNRPKRFLGWRVRVQWRGERREASFADSTYGGVQHSLAAALTWRDAQERGMKKPRTEAWIRSRGASGRAGKRYEWER